MLGKKQWIIVAGSLLVLGSGLGALTLIDLAAAKAYLDFAGGFAWKAILAIAFGAAAQEGAKALAKRNGNG